MHSLQLLLIKFKERLFGYVNVMYERMLLGMLLKVLYLDSLMFMDSESPVAVCVVDMNRNARDNIGETRYYQ